MDFLSPKKDFFSRSEEIDSLNLALLSVKEIEYSLTDISKKLQELMGRNPQNYQIVPESPESKNASIEEEKGEAIQIEIQDLLKRTPFTLSKKMNQIGVAYNRIGSRCDRVKYTLGDTLNRWEKVVDKYAIYGKCEKTCDRCESPNLCLTWISRRSLSF